MINPYANVDWGSCEQIVTTSHTHSKSQASFTALYNGGVRFFTISNYYASQPLYPEVDGEISGIPSQRETITVPEGCIVSANSEHHGMSVPSLHMNSLGSTFTSGTPETYNPDTQEWERHPPTGMNGANWKRMIDGTIRNLLYEDSGGITINHPVWTNSQNANFTVNTICEILDYSPYVLGQEVIDGGMWDRDARTWWDNVLITGRRSWGFFVPDHQNSSQPTEWIGRNILLVPEFEEHACLRAYRTGEFYGRKGWTNLSFTNISASDHTITVETNSADTIAFIEDGVRTEISGSSATYTSDPEAVYTRVEAEGLDDIIFSQPFIFKEYTKKRSFESKAVLWTA